MFKTLRFYVLLYFSMVLLFLGGTIYVIIFEGIPKPSFMLVSGVAIVFWTYKLLGILLDIVNNEIVFEEAKLIEIYVNQNWNGVVFKVCFDNGNKKIKLSPVFFKDYNLLKEKFKGNVGIYYTKRSRFLLGVKEGNQNKFFYNVDAIKKINR